MVRNIVFYEEHFSEFYDSQSEKVQEKIDYVLNLIAYVERVPEKFLKHLEGTEGLYEIRVKFSSDIFRFFCFFDEEKLVIVLHGFQKKTQKTPKNEIKKAEVLKQKYLTEKEA
ncbi:type II toxin-antitoxin system RelE/ParE family toxin [Hugenholtzia roseola]|uniref:type II toxin-antitoxin system RelE/ParE family toxin n=1 Tax=Hugenholtzia roseola TaxID=1002 RepID=UPI0004075570|nr:type II toxin-antitoxin system RelE/ParE family toxin [Hugenholtzia roseola]